jgi:hypothetical protein
MSDEDEVGYGRPPKRHMFKKGRSGNPKGRPKKKPIDPAQNSLQQVLKRAGEQTINLNGEEMTLFEVEVRALQHKAAKGDVAASRHLAKLRSEAGMLKSATPGTGVLLVPAPMNLDDWSVAAAAQQAKFRGEDPEELARLHAAAEGTMAQSRKRADE